MPLFWKPYRSEVTQFLDTLKQQRPQLEAEQKAGRALLWDKAPANPEQRSGFEAARVPQQPYVYQTAPQPLDGSA
ncbi:DUF3460 family protein [Amphibiibacter pelophylacis]|uniref:DUF3460 family protein n=1 Tax=Amphibiibacter pelophylacis TaxID=1799477 RepID=A0ACC6P1H8_9BURK